MKPYLDFELSIQREGEGYRSRVLKAPAGEAAGAFISPFTDLEIENFMLRIGGRRQSMRRIDSPEAQAARIFGERLFRAAFPEGVRDCLRGSLDDAAGGEAGLRIRLRLNEVPELADLPWEYLWDPLRKRFLALSTDTPIVRYLEVPERIRPLEIQPPLRILTMIPSPAGVEPLDTEQEWTLLSTALEDLIRRGRVTLDRLEKATLMNLHRRLRQGHYHILHFVGHGAFDERAQDSVLVLEDEQGKARMVGGHDLATLLQDRKTLRLAVLNACEGARASRTDPFAGTAQSLVQGGIPAVIAMQFEISDQAAITFAAELYHALAEGFPIDAALAEARLAIFAQGNGLEWGTPVLYLRAPDGRIFDVGTKSPTAKPDPTLTPPPISSQVLDDQPETLPEELPALPSPDSADRAATKESWASEEARLDVETKSPATKPEPLPIPPPVRSQALEDQPETLPEEPPPVLFTAFSGKDLEKDATHEDPDWVLRSIVLVIVLGAVLVILGLRGCKKPEEEAVVEEQLTTHIMTTEITTTEMGTDMTAPEPMTTGAIPPAGQ